jgi:molecular chaperone GrpE (heat shock protein)
MSCYLRHMKDFFDSLGIEVTPQTKKDIDRAVHKAAGIEYKDCSSTWKIVKDIIKGSETQRKEKFIQTLKKETFSL